MNVKEIKINDFDYLLPDEKIAKHPLLQRDACKLLVRNAGKITHSHFRDIADFLPERSMLIGNNTKVINARLRFTKETGATVEIFLLDPIAPRDYALMFQSTGSCRWCALVGNLKRWKEGLLSKKVICAGKEVVITAERIGVAGDGLWEVEFKWSPADINFADVIEAAGFIPIPPYLNRETEESDTNDYQTVYSKIKGSVAAPTAGLHFTDEVIADLRAKGFDWRELTLHVGAGTFKPVKVEAIGQHEMHTETFTISRTLLVDIIKAKEENRPLIAIGTTSVRTLESLPLLGMNGTDTVSQWEAYQSDADTLSALKALLKRMDDNGEEVLHAATSIMIAPGFTWRVVDGIVTNFHQPHSTLLLLVASFLGRNGKIDEWRNIYEEALKNDYRFLSYGDGSLLL
jgi:S-adenosylmethionine:tRNA ribosyltransferase-isomerase